MGCIFFWLLFFGLLLQVAMATHFTAATLTFSPQSLREAAKGLGVDAFLNVTFLQEITVQRAPRHLQLMKIRRVQSIHINIFLHSLPRV